jgi:hypothetical protein
MKQGIFILGMSLMIACKGKQNTTDNYDLTDSLGNKMTDTTGRGDTAYYERMQQKTGYDTASGNTSGHRHDTAYYERMPNKSNPPDSSH